MFYYASKILWFFATPSNLLIILIVIGALLAMTRRFRRAGAALALIVGIGTLVVGLSPVSSYLMLPLENRFPAYRDDGRPVTGIILLGGSVEAEKSLSRGMLIANEAAERVLGTIALAHLYPQARILISSGSGSLLQNAAAEAPVIANYFKTIGIDPARVMIEDRSRTTFENAVFSRALANPKPGERWLLVTSAWHMPRSVGVFPQGGLRRHGLSGGLPDRQHVVGSGDLRLHVRRPSPPRCWREGMDRFGSLSFRRPYQCASACPSGLADRQPGRFP